MGGDMYMTDKERRILEDSISVLSNSYPFTQFDDGESARNIVAVQFYIGAHYKPGSRPRDELYYPCRVLLAKLREAYPMRSQVLVTWNVLDLQRREDMTWFSKICIKYSSDWNGLGNWSGSCLANESLVAACYYASVRQYPAVIPLTDLRKMRQLYLDQEAAALEAAERARTTKKSEKLVKSDDALDQFIGASASARRETVADGRGTCYRCGVPKPRGRVCAICGYTPRSALGR